jgi:transcriptional regulator of acetoin/glycerol metabolism
LAECFFNKIRLKNQKSIRSVSNAAMARLMEYSWPGNVRELKSALEYAFVTCQDGIIAPQHLPPSINGKTAGSAPQASRKAGFNREEIKRLELIEALEITNGNQSKAAELLGVTRVTVWNRMRRFGVQFTKSIQK